MELHLLEVPLLVVAVVVVVVVDSGGAPRQKQGKLSSSVQMKIASLN